MLSMRVAPLGAVGTGGRALLLCLVFASCDVSPVVIDRNEPIDPVILANARMEILSGDDQEGIVGEGLATPLVVLITDEMGAALPGAPVVWVFRQGRGSGRGNSNVSTMIRVTTDEQGRAAAHWELGTTTGIQWAAVEIPTPAPTGSVDAGISPAPPSERQRKVEFKARGMPAKASAIVFSPASLTLEVGETADITAQVVDRYGNVIPDAEIRFVTEDPSIATFGSPPSGSLVQVADAMPVPTGERRSPTVLVGPDG